MVGGGEGKRTRFSVKSSTLRVADITTSFREWPDWGREGGKNTA